MSDVIQFPRPSGPTPVDRRARVLAEVVRQAASKPWRQDVGDVFAGVLKALDAKEEDIGADIWSALALMIRVGLLDSMDHDLRTGTVTFQAGTEVVTSTMLTAFMFSGFSVDDDDDDDDDDGGKAA